MDENWDMIVRDSRLQGQFAIKKVNVNSEDDKDVGSNKITEETSQSSSGERKGRDLKKKRGNLGAINDDDDEVDLDRERSP